VRESKSGDGIQDSEQARNACRRAGVAKFYAIKIFVTDSFIPRKIMNEIERKIYGLELSLLTPEVRSSVDKLNNLLSDDFIEFGSSGLIYDKKEILERLPANFEKVEYIISDFNAEQLSEGIIFTTYKTDRIINDTDKLTSLRSSVWRNINGNWQMFFHQGTPIK